MAIKTAKAEWRGGLMKGEGTVELGSGAFKGNYGFKSRFESGPGTNPEELIGAAHAGCFSMAFSKVLGDAGFEPRSIRTAAKVHLDQDGGGFTISRIELDMVAEIPEIEQGQFQELAETAKENCPVSKALAGPEISLTARLA